MFQRTVFGHKKDARDVFKRIPLNTPCKLYVSPMPYGPYDPDNKLMGRYKKFAIKRVIVLASEDEIVRKGRKDLFDRYAAMGIEVTHFPFPDLTAPILEDMRGLVASIIDDLQHRNLAIHCNAGVGRTGVVSACIIRSRMRCSGEEALGYLQEQMLREITDEQKRFVIRWAEKDRLQNQLS